MSVTRQAITALSAALSARRLPIFAARFASEGRATLTLSTMDASTGALRRDAAAVLQSLGLAADIHVLRRSPSRLRRARSLESLLKLTGRGDLVVDGTWALRRAELVVELAREIRHALPQTRALFLEPERRTLFVLLPQAAMGDLSPKDVLQQVQTAWQGWFDEAASLDIAIRVCHVTPTLPGLAVVDEGTGRSLIRALLRTRRIGHIVRVAVALLSGAATSAPVYADAVVMPNLNLSAGGVVNTGRVKGLARLGGRFALPLGKAAGAQVDLGVGTGGSAGVGLHVFERDKHQRLGIVASAEREGTVNMFRLGAEGEIYADQVTVYGAAGYQTGDVMAGAWAKLDLSYYPDPNLSLTAGVEVQPDLRFAHLGFEWVPAVDTLPELSVFGDVGVTSDSAYRTMFGVNFQVGSKASLIERDRTYNVKSALFSPIKAKPSGYGGKG